LNVMDAHLEGFEKKVLPVLLTLKAGVIGMKPIGGGHILESGAVNAEECLRYAMSLPVSVVVTGCESLPVLHQAINAARNFSPLTEEEISSLLSKTEKAAKKEAYELYKTSDVFDSTEHNREWLGA
jgi:uncharacterized protein